jgi:hypothetical protein
MKHRADLFVTDFDTKRTENAPRFGYYFLYDAVSQELQNWPGTVYFTVIRHEKYYSDCSQLQVLMSSTMRYGE